jgi:hypothetical protein
MCSENTRCQIGDGSIHFPANELQERQGREYFNNSSFINRYIEGEAHILVRVLSGNGDELLACFYRDCEAGPGGHDMNGKGDSCGPILAGNQKSSFELLSFAWGHSAGSWYKGHGQQQSVFVANVELMKLPEFMPIPSLVWLDTVERVLARLPKALYLCRRAVTVSLGAIENWESGVLVGCLSCCDLHRRRQIIERTAEIMNGVPKYQGDCVGHIGDGLNVVSDVASLLVGIRGNVVSVAIPEKPRRQTQSP